MGTLSINSSSNHGSTSVSILVHTEDVQNIGAVGEEWKLLQRIATYLTLLVFNSWMVQFRVRPLMLQSKVCNH